MGALIHLANPTQADPAASRVYYAAGRSLTATDFGLQASYTDWRLLGLVSANTGAIAGLGVTPTPATGAVTGRYDSPDGVTGLTSLTIGPGTGMGGDGRVVRLTTPLMLSWPTLLQAVNPAGTLANGIYLLIVRTATLDGLEGPAPDPCSRASPDPLLDLRQDSFVEAWLSASLGPLPTSRSTAGLALAINTLVGSLTATTLASAVGNGIPLALVLIQANKAILLSQAAGRLPADPDGIGLMLLAQVREAFAMALAEPLANPASPAWQTALAARFRYLPPAAELPLGLLLASASLSPSCPFVPPGLAVFLQTIRASQAPYILAKALGRPLIDVTAGNAEAVTLSLAVPDAAWTPDLLDMPRGDPVLAGDLHFAYARARGAQVTLREDWISLYGGLTANMPAAFAPAIAFLIGADAAAQNLAFLLTVGALQTQYLLQAATAANAPATLLPLVSGWIAALNAAASVAPAAAGAAAPVAAIAFPLATAAISTGTSAATSAAGSVPPTPQAVAQAVVNALTPGLSALNAWPAAASAATAAAGVVGATAGAIAIAAATAAASATLPASLSQGALASEAAAAAGAAARAAASAAVAAVAAAFPASAAAATVSAAALAAATPPMPIPPAPPAAPNPTDAPHLLAALGYQVVDVEPAQADPTLPNPAPVSSDSVLGPLVPYLPPNSAFANWSAAISTVPPNPKLLQPLIDAGVVDASADTTTQAAAIAALLALPAAGDPANDDSQPGTLLQLATLQLFYAVLGRIARAQEYLLDGHSRLLALQRQHLDMMSTYVSALAGGVPSDGSGLSFTRIIPFFNLNAVPPSPASAPTPPPTPSPAPAPAPAMRAMPIPQTRALMVNQTEIQPVASRSGTQLVTGATQVNGAESVVDTTRVAGNIQLFPTRSTIDTLFGSQVDIAQQVASQTAALSQAPPFSYQPVQYGQAAHITSGATLFQSAQTGLIGLRGLMAKAPIFITPGAATPTAAGGDDMTNYNSIVQITRALLDDMNLVETNAIRVESGYMQLRDQVQSMQATVSQLTAALAAARDTLRAAQVAAAKAGGDYAAAQTLVREETARVAAAVVARNQAIAAATGLFMTRQLQTIIVRDPPASLSLTADMPADLAPGCTADHPGPPASLMPFLDLLLEVPLANWTTLKDGWTDLPDNAGLQRLGALRAARLANWSPSTDFGGGAAANDLANIASGTRAVFDPLLRAGVTLGASLATSQMAAFAVFSLPDLVTLPVNLLRTNSEALRARLESATGCLFATLIGLPPSARFAWATLARAGTLPSLSFAQWPLPPGSDTGLGTAGAATLRQLAGLVGWMARQLTDGVSAAAQTALGNLVAAAVIAAAYGDPDEAVTGTVVSTGGVPQPGVSIRVVLNRPPPIGTVLNVFDASQTLAATVRVQDHDAFGTTAAVVSSFATTAPTAAWTIAAPGGRAPWLAS